MKRAIRLKVNGRPVSLETEDDRTLLWVLRTDLALTGTKYGCGAGICGACTVVVNGQALRSCLATLKDVEGRELTTIEGLAHEGELNPLQRAFVEHGGFQCGFCTSGMIMNAHALLQHSPHPSPQAILDGMENNLCRCGAHPRILAAIEAVAKTTDGRS